MCEALCIVDYNSDYTHCNNNLDLPGKGGMISFFETNCVCLCRCSL